MLCLYNYIANSKAVQSIVSGGLQLFYKANRTQAPLGEEQLRNNSFDEISSNLVSNPTFDLGSEEVTNGDFSAGATGWAITGGSVSTGALTLNVVSSSFSYAIQSMALTSGTKYMLNVRVKGSNSNAGFRPTDNNSGTGGLKGGENRVQLTTDYQDFEFVFTANSNSIQVTIERDTSWGTDFDVIVD